MFGLLGILKNPLGNIKQIAILVFVGALAAYCVTLWVKNNGLVEKAATDAVIISTYTAANEAMATKIESDRVELERVDGLLRKAQSEKDNAEPIYRERIVYVKAYRDNPNIAKCNLAPEWVSAHNQAATNPYVPANNPSTGGIGSNTAGSGQATLVDDGLALEIVNSNYAKYYELKHNYISLLNVCKGVTVQPVETK